MGEDDEVEDDDDDVDFNPFLQLSPRAAGHSGGSSDVISEVDEGDVAVPAVSEPAVSEPDVLELQEGGELGDEDGFLELGSEADEDEGEFVDDEEEELEEDWNEVDSSRQESGKLLEVEEDKFRGWDQDTGSICEVENDFVWDEAGNHIRGQNSGHSSFAAIESGPNCERGAQEYVPGSSEWSLPYIKCTGITKQSVDGQKMVNSEDEDLVDAISKRTRARYSLAKMSLDQLETFLQETDEEDYFQNVDDEEEYRKFLVAVQLKPESVDREVEIQNGIDKAKEEDDDEDDDADFEIEIDEALESDCDAALKEDVKLKRRMPETREKRRQRAKLQGRSSKLPLRPILPYTHNWTNSGSFMKRRMITDTGGRAWTDLKSHPPVNGFTAHQIGQLYCLIHEHVQLLVQVFSLCILEPTRQQMALDTHRMLMELVEKRETLLSWKKTAFPDFCFHPPYIHPSSNEGKTNAPGFFNLPPHYFPVSPLLSNDSALTNGAHSQKFPRKSSCGSVMAGVTHSHQPLAPEITTPFWYNFSMGSNPSGGSSYCVPPVPDRHDITGATDANSLVPFSPVNMFCSPISSDHSSSLPQTMVIQPTSTQVSAMVHPPIQSGPISPVGAPYTKSGEISPFLVGTQSMQCASRAKDFLPATAKPWPFNHAATNVPELAITVPCRVQSHSQGFSPVVDSVNLPTSVLEKPISLSGAHNYGIAACYNSSVLHDLADVNLEWVPSTSGPVRSLLDVAPLALVREFLADIAQVVQDYRHKHVESGTCHSQFERDPLFAFRTLDEEDAIALRRKFQGLIPSSVPQPKKTMAATLVESTKRSVALVPKEVACAVQRFLLFFNEALFPRKPPPAATANRLLFTDAEDELLAMGLMMYNTDWNAIQQRYLPSKSMHQIFVRQKNRSSSRAPENSIKAVRKMKSSPLTPAEKSCIQEALGVFKFDWTKVWQYCVPYRDPALLPRQWRIALGTQKSYKISDSSKERRRLYEANRRQAAKNEASYSKEDLLLSFDENQFEGDGHSGEDGDSEGAYIREAFLANWVPRISTLSSPNPADCHVDKEIFTKPAMSRKKKTKAQSSQHQKSLLAAAALAPGIPSFFVPGSLAPNCSIKKQTVKLAPDLPSVKLPPHVQVLSQSQAQNLQPFSLGSKWIPPPSQWPPIIAAGMLPTDSSPSTGTNVKGKVHFFHHQVLNNNVANLSVLESVNGVQSQAPKSHSFFKTFHTVRKKTKLKSVPKQHHGVPECSAIVKAMATNACVTSPVEMQEICNPVCNVTTPVHSTIGDLSSTASLILSNSLVSVPNPIQKEKWSDEFRGASEKEGISNCHSVPGGVVSEENSKGGGKTKKKFKAKKFSNLQCSFSKDHQQKNRCISLQRCSKGSLAETQHTRLAEISPKIPKRKYQRKKKAGVQTVEEEHLLEIVMEQEELLSDSEEEITAGVHFEHEEMGDSDRESTDNDAQLAPSKECHIEFEVQEIGIDKEREYPKNKVEQGVLEPTEDLLQGVLIAHGSSQDGLHSQMLATNSGTSCGIGLGLQSITTIRKDMKEVIPENTDCSVSVSSMTSAGAEFDSSQQSRDVCHSNNTSSSQVQQSFTSDKLGPVCDEHISNDLNACEEEHDAIAIAAAQVLAVIGQVTTVHPD